MNVSLENLRGVARGGRRALAVPVALGLAMALVACDDDDDAAASGAAEKTEQVDEFAGLTEVDAETFDMEPFMDGYAFDFRAGGDAVGVCLASDGTVSCLGELDDSAPDAAKSLPGRPNGIELTGDATEFVNYDFTGGVPPEEELVAGQKVSFGSVTCGMVDDSTLKCREDEAWFSITGADREIEVGPDGSGDASSATTSSAASVSDVDPDKFAVNDTGKNAWVLEDGKSICWVMEAGNSSPGVGCNVQLKNPPKDPTHGNPATKFHLGTDGEATLRPDIAGVTPFDYQTLGANERVTLRGVTCTAHGGSDITCEASGTTVEVKNGEAPEIPVVDGMGGGSDSRADGSGSEGAGVRTSGACGTVQSSSRPNLSGDVLVREGTIDCDEVMPIVERYIETSSDGQHGMENWRFYGNWTCTNPRELGGAEPQFVVSCFTDDGDRVAIANSAWRP